jgi:hypothetical protein
MSEEYLATLKQRKLWYWFYQRMGLVPFSPLSYINFAIAHPIVFTRFIAQSIKNRHARRTVSHD